MIALPIRVPDDLWQRVRLEARRRRPPHNTDAGMRGALAAKLSLQSDLTITVAIEGPLLAYIVFDDLDEAMLWAMRNTTWEIAGPAQHYP